MSIGQLCNRNTVTVRKEDSIAATAQLMRESHVGSVVVVEDAGTGPKPIGILTDRDLVVEILATGLDPAAVGVGDIMSYPLAVAREDEGLWEIMQRMRAQGVRRLPVVDGQGHLVGIVASDDLLELLAGELGQLAKIVNQERARERTQRGSLEP
ncbi:CBS domain-containing protein [Methylomagnum ishizawai]|uniref:CBS domain-containing protein n=1 Tax=Methylomagnum ishizawai TaxID=1760988 RepID=A0A1Y6D281_9GAMM|nr:CBS domain-containing protein [Methylomagnum ishizawai]SMF94662.1 CBS domain-containing protein [Methylomagnum ishizawai]